MAWTTERWTLAECLNAARSEIAAVKKKAAELNTALAAGTLEKEKCLNAAVQYRRIYADLEYIKGRNGISAYAAAQLDDPAIGPKFVAVQSAMQTAFSSLMDQIETHQGSPKLATVNLTTAEITPILVDPESLKGVELAAALTAVVNA